MLWGFDSLSGVVHHSKIIHGALALGQQPKSPAFDGMSVSREQRGHRERGGSSAMGPQTDIRMAHIKTNGLRKIASRRPRAKRAFLWRHADAGRIA
jgi:hypothetical protein